MPDDKPDISNPFGSPAQDEGEEQIFLGIDEGEAFDGDAPDESLPVPGTYRCRCIHAERSVSKNNNDMFVLTYKIIGDPKYPDVEFKDWQVLIHSRVKEIARLYKVFGISAQGKTRTGVSSFVGKEVLNDITHREDGDRIFIDVKKTRPYVRPTVAPVFDNNPQDDEDIPF